MTNISIIAVRKQLIITLTLCGIAVIAPLFHSQLITGSIVNAALFGAVMLAGFRAAASVAVIPSLIALAVGTLPLTMAPMIPFIMVSNIALAGVFALLKKTNYWLAAISASLIKFGLLILSANIILGTITHGQMTLALASMMGWPQLITAILGAVLAYVFLKNGGNSFAESNLLH